MKFFIAFGLYFCLAFAKHEQYQGYVVYEVYPNKLSEIPLIYEVVNNLTLDVWSYANLDTPGEIFVSGTQRKAFENALETAGIEYKVSVKNIRELLDLEDRMLNAPGIKRNRNTTDLTYDAIYTFEQVTKYLEAIAENFPNVTKLVNAGDSFEGRPIQYLEISNSGFQNTSKPIIVLQSLLHAREWVTLPVTLHAINKLVVNITESDLLHNFDWLIIPVANPDGYIYSHTDDRFWRKNRRTGFVANDTCIGVDLNRNFNIDWSKASSFDVCSNTFHGPAPNSEIEIQAIIKVLHKYIERIAMYSDMHSHGSMIVYGWGNGTLVPNALIQHVLAVNMAVAIDAVKWPSKPNYRVGNISQLLNYLLSGGSTDYAQAIGIPFSYTYELPALLGGTGVNNFLVDPAFIEQAAVETWTSIIVATRFISGFF